MHSSAAPSSPPEHARSDAQPGGGGDVAGAIREVAETTPSVTIAAVFMMSGDAPPELRSERARVPAYGFPEDAAQAIAHAVRHASWRGAEAGSFPDLQGIRSPQAAALISKALAGGGGWLAPAQVVELLGCYSRPLIPTMVVDDAEGAAAAAVRLGTPIALKASAPGLVHKTDAGGVRLGLADTEAVRTAAAAIKEAVARAGHRLNGLIVQPMAPEAGVELIVGIVNDHSFGPVLACGAGGTIAELVKDVAVRITPVTDLDARKMVRSLRTFPLLDGYRGAPPCDVAAIEDVLLRVSAMVEAHPEIAELDCNPVIAGPDGALIIDARVRVEAVAPPPPVPSIEV